ncbi:MAG: hypothetical protein K0R54_152 [Clostridiaceae bacterium]|jgi:hypothetical protein|nr:hypothetical protein [Clostridiaceae bacterium]
MDIKQIILYTTISEKCKEEYGNNDGIYDGEWVVTDLNYRYKKVELSNSRVSITRGFDEINQIYIKG